MVYALEENSRLTQFLEEVNDLDRSKKIVLVYDDDADGLSSGIVLFETLKRLGFTNITPVPKTKDRPVFAEPFLSAQLEEGVDLFFIVDFEPISWKFLTMEKMSGLPVQFFIIDHHFDQTQLYDSLENVKFIHPRNCSDAPDAAQYCCSKFVFDVCMKLTNVSDLLYKVLPGMIGDMNIIKWGDYIREEAKTLGVEIGPDRDAFFHSIYGKVSDVVAFASSIDADEVDALFDVYYKTRDLQDVLAFAERYKHIAQEYYRLVNMDIAIADVDPDTGVLFIEIRTDSPLTSAASSRISYMHENNSFFFYQLQDTGYYHISVRSQRTDIHLGEIIGVVAKKIPHSNGGGHAPAAGAITPKKHFETFKQMYIEEYKKRTKTS